MKKRIVSFVLAMCMVVGVMPGHTAGAEEDEWVLISTPAELYSLLNSNKSGRFKLNNDIDLAGYNSGKWKPIGSKNSPFNGTLDGNGHSILNLSLSSGSGTERGSLASWTWVGLFGYTSGANISNLYINIKSCDAEGASYVHLGGLIGHDVDSTIKNVHVSGNTLLASPGTLSWAYHGGSVGGIVGVASENTIITDSSNTCSTEIDGDYYGVNAGGITGSGGKIYRCANSGRIYARGDGDGYVGGISGYKASISRCRNVGTVRLYESWHYGSGVNAGGILGYGNDVSDSYNTGHVSCYVGSGTPQRATAGGISGSSSNVTNCYNIGTVVAETCITSKYFISGIGNVTADDMNDLSNYKDFDFNNIWTMTGIKGYQYPQLRNVKIADSEKIAVRDTISLFRNYPEYLNNMAFFEVINSCSDTVGYTIDSIPSGKFKWGKYLHYQANMGGILWDSFAEIVAMSCAEDYTNAVERAQDEQLLELLRGLESSSSVLKGIVAEVGDAFRENMEYVTGVGDTYDFAYTTATAQFASDLSQATKGKYSPKNIEEITEVVTGKWGKISNLLGDIGDKIKPAEVITTLVMTDMVNSKLIDLLWKKSGQGTDLHAALGRMIDRRTTMGNVQYFIETYLVEEVLAKLGEYAPGLISNAINYISKAGVTATQLSLAYNIAKGVVDISVWVVQQYPGTLVIDDYNAAVINWGNNATFRKILADDRMRFLNYKYSSTAPSVSDFNREIEEYEIIYCGLIATMRTALQNARKLTTRDSTQDRIDEHIKMLDTWTYDYYIQSCKNNVINAQADKFKYEVIDNKVKITGLPEVMTASEEDYSMLVIPDEIDGLPVTSIAEGAFAGYSTFNAVIIPDSVTDMGTGAFEGCTQLNAAIIGNGISEIGDNSFKGCTALKTAGISENTKTIGEGAFANCTSLGGVVIPESVETVKTNAFSGNSALTEVTVLGKNSQLSETAFEGSSGVTVKAYSDSAAQTFAAEKNISFEELEPTVTNLEITKMPDKLRFEKGEAIDASGMELKAIYNDGSAETVTEGWISSCDIATPGKQTVTVFYGEGTATYDVVINAGWTTETDAGYYNENGEKHGIMRYLFHADISGKVTESGVKFIKSETDDTQVGEIIKGEPSKAFYGDIVNIPENTVGKYFAKGFVVVDGIMYWSDPLGCVPDFTKEFKK